MGEVEPSPPVNAGATVGGTILGVVLGVPGSAIVSIVLITMIPSAMSCTGGVLVGIVGLLLLALICWAAWHVDFRTRGGFGIGLARGALTTMALFYALPWPCSLSWASYFTAYGACVRH